VDGREDVLKLRNNSVSSDEWSARAENDSRLLNGISSLLMARDVHSCTFHTRDAGNSNGSGRAIVEHKTRIVMCIRSVPRDIRGSFPVLYTHK